jgi:hypothetical protein
VSFWSVAQDVIHGLGLAFLNPGQTRGFKGEIGPGATPPGFNQTCYKFGPGLNPGESYPDC